MTGLALVRWPAKGTWRVFKSAYDPLSGRTRTSENPQDWNRFDLPESATLYSSTEPQGAYAEVLASLRPRISELAKLAADVFNDVEEGTDPITEEWGAKGFVAVGNIPKIWHADRNIAQINVQSPGWYVDVEHPVRRDRTYRRRQRSHVDAPIPAGCRSSLRFVSPAMR